MSETGQAATAPDRLRCFEMGTLAVLGGCVAVHLIAAASEAYTGPATLLDAIAAWPTHVWCALGVGVVGAVVPFTTLGQHLPGRICGLVLVGATALWLGTGIVIAVLYSVAMKGFD